MPEKKESMTKKEERYAINARATGNMNIDFESFIDMVRPIIMTLIIFLIVYGIFWLCVIITGYPLLGYPSAIPIH